MVFYLRTENNKIEFLADDVHEIKSTDLLLSNEDYEKFFELQSQGKQYKLREIVTLEISSGLFDYIEEFENEPIITEEIITLENLMNEIEALKNEIKNIKLNLSLE